MKKIFYLCDGKNDKCSDDHSNCYFNGGDCAATEDIEHAQNFYIGSDGNSYWEKNSEFRLGASKILTKKEMGFLITCIQEAASENFYYSPRFNERYTPESGIKYAKLNKEEISNLLRKLDGDSDDFEELFEHL